MIAILLLDIQTNKFIALPSFPNSYHLRANFPNYKGPGPQIQMSMKITGISRLDIVWELDLHLPMQSVPITTSVVSSKPALTWRGVLDTTLCEKVCQ